MNSIKWLKVGMYPDGSLPERHKVVLGWWSNTCIRTCALREHRIHRNVWGEPNYYYTNELTEPVYYAIITEDMLP